MKLQLFKPNKIQRHSWDSEYLWGKWGFLKSLPELAHYSIIVGYFKYLKPGGTILDVGCGEGILQGQLSANLYSKYVGIDVSEQAIKQASYRCDEKTFFVKAEADKYTPEEKFDTIIFNESLYYISNPVETLRKYESYLNPNGFFIISNYQGMKILQKLTKKIKLTYPILDETTIINKVGVHWVCLVIKLTGGSK